MIVAGGQRPAVVAKEATATIPIVMPVSTDPMGWASSRVLRDRGVTSQGW